MTTSRSTILFLCLTALALSLSWGCSSSNSPTAPQPTATPTPEPHNFLRLSFGDGTSCEGSITSALLSNTADGPTLDIGSSACGSFQVGITAIVPSTTPQSWTYPVTVAHTIGQLTVGLTGPANYGTLLCGDSGSLILTSYSSGHLKGSLQMINVPLLPSSVSQCDQAPDKKVITEGSFDVDAF